MSNVYNYFVSNPVMAITFMVLLILLLITLFIQAMQTEGLEKIRAIVYKGFVTAEHEFEQGENTQKFEYVVNLARSAIPSPFRFFITEAILREVIQLWFDVCKDLLDDGKINNTVKVSEEEEKTEETPNTDDEDLEEEGEDNV